MIRPSSTRTPLIVVAASLLAACGDAGTGGAGDGWVVERDTVGDTVVVRTVSGSVWGEGARLVEEFRIGALEGPEEYTFGRIAGLAIAPDGSIYVVDEQVPALRKYAPDGTYLGTYGRKGSGPGEYERPDAGLTVLSDGRVLIRDPANARIAVFSSDGEPLDGWRIKGGTLTNRPLFRDTADRVYHYDFSFDGPDQLVRFGPDGQRRDSLAIPEWDDEPAVVEATSPDGTGRSRHTVPFTPRGVWSFHPHGYFVTAFSDRYAIRLRRPEGPVLRIEKRWEPVPVLDGEKENRRAITTASMRRMDPGWRWNGPGIPDTKPAFRRLFVDGDGRIWVHVHARAREIPAEELEVSEPGPDEPPPLRWREPVVLDVFESDGRYLGRLRTREGFRLYPQPVGRGHTLWAVVTDELEVHHVVRFRIQAGDS